MQTVTASRFAAIRSTAITFALLAVGYCLGAAGESSRPANAGVRESPPRKAFQSGGARSEVVLQEISATLKRIEARVGTIEKTVTARSGR